jgi:hypothetical protein
MRGPAPARSVAPRRGAYGGPGTGVNVSSPLVLVGGPLAIVTVVVFDGHGHLSVPVETTRFGGDVRRLTAPAAATYDVARDRTGTLRFDEENVVDGGGSGRGGRGGTEVLAIHAPPGFVHTVVLERRTAGRDPG